MRYRRQAEHELRALGRRRRGGGRARSGEPGPGALTERELGIARLVMERRTNSEIAAELVVSRKTVESHVSNILRKLGVASRVEIGRADRPSRHRVDVAGSIALTRFLDDDRTFRPAGPG